MFSLLRAIKFILDKNSKVNLAEDVAVNFFYSEYKYYYRTLVSLMLPIFLLLISPIIYKYITKTQEFLIIVAALFIISFFIMLSLTICYYYYRLPENIGIATALLEITKIRKSNARLSDKDYDQLIKLFRLMNESLYRLAFRVGGRRRTLIKQFKDLSREKLSVITLRCSQDAFNSLISDLTEVRNIFYKTYSIDLEDQLEKLNSKIESNEEFKKRTKNYLKNKIKFLARYIMSEDFVFLLDEIKIRVNAIAVILVLLAVVYFSWKYGPAKSLVTLLLPKI